MDLIKKHLSPPVHYGQMILCIFEVYDTVEEKKAGFF